MALNFTEQEKKELKEEFKKQDELYNQYKESGMTIDEARAIVEGKTTLNEVLESKGIKNTLTEDVEDITDERVLLLAEYLGVDPSTISQSSYDDKEYETEDGEEYLVLTYDEAQDYARQDIENLVDDIGFEAFSPSFVDWIMWNAVEEDAFEEWQEEGNRSYCQDIASESSRGFANRLVEECYDENLISDDDFAVSEEDGEPNYEECLIDEDELVDRYTDYLCSRESSVDYLRGIYGDRDLADIVIRENAIDMDVVVDECISMDGLAHFIARYDGDEIDLGNGYYAYRTN